MDAFSNFQADVAAQAPQWVQIWMNILGAVVVPTVVIFLFRRSLWPAAALIAVGIPATIVVYAIFGYERIMGLGHVLLWTPALIYLWIIRDTWKVSETLIGKWIVVSGTFMIASLVFDYFDVARWLLGADV